MEEMCGLPLLPTVRREKHCPYCDVLVWRTPDQPAGGESWATLEDAEEHLRHLDLRPLPREKKEEV